MVDESEILLADGLEEAFIGVAQQFNKHFAVYDREKAVKVFMDRDDMTREDAEEWFEFNVVGAWVGENTPAFVTQCSFKELATGIIHE